MTPKQLKQYLQSLVKNEIRLSTMIWGAPGIGKSSIVKQVAKANELEFIDLRLSQLAPTDLRGLPVALPSNNNNTTGISTWYPPEFLPNSGKGILFLDELNMAVPAMQGVAQQLILDRCVGSYEVPQGWYIWSAGNRKQDKASVFEMPSPLANRFLHLEIEPSFEDFKEYAIQNNLHEQIVAFLSYRSNLLFTLSEEKSFPTPRSWEMASQLLNANLSIAPAVGDATNLEFKTFIKLYDTIPDLDKVLKGDYKGVHFPTESSALWATIVGLVYRMETQEEMINGYLWLIRNESRHEWLHLFLNDLYCKCDSKPIGERINNFDFWEAMNKHPEIMDATRKWEEMITD